MLRNFDASVRQLSLAITGIELELSRLMEEDRTAGTLKRRRELFASLTESNNTLRSLAERGLHQEIKQRLKLSIGNWLLETIDLADEALSLGGYWEDKRFDSHEIPADQLKRAHQVIDALRKRWKRSLLFSRMVEADDPRSKKRRLSKAEPKATKNDERDSFIYRLCCEGKLDRKQILAEVVKQRLDHGKEWSVIKRRPAIFKAAARYAKCHGLPAPPVRRSLSRS